MWESICKWFSKLLAYAATAFALYTSGKQSADLKQKEAALKQTDETHEIDQAVDNLSADDRNRLRDRFTVD